MDTGPVEHATSLSLARAAANSCRKRAQGAEKVIADLMAMLDDTTTPLYSLVDADDRHEWLRGTDAWKAAAHVLGWDVDWEALAEGRMP